MSEQGKWDVRWDEALGLWVYTSPNGEDFVPSRADDQVDYEYVPKTPGLSHLRLTKVEQSNAAKGAATRAARKERELAKRGLV